MSAAMQVREVEGWSLAFTAGDEEPRVRDVDMAARLGFRRPRDVRKIIDRMVAAGKLGSVKVRDTVAQTSGGRPGREFWLTEAQALKVAAKSETEPADALLDEMIHVFMMARRGLAPLAAPAPLAPAPMHEATWEMLTSALLKIDALTQTVAVMVAGRGSIGGLQADWITGEVDSLAALRVLLGYHPTPRAAKSWIQGRIAAASEWAGAGARRRDMPADRYPRVKVCLAQMRSDLEAELARREPAAPPPTGSPQTALAFQR